MSYDIKFSLVVSALFLGLGFVFGHAMTAITVLVVAWGAWAFYVMGRRCGPEYARRKAESEARALDDRLSAFAAEQARREAARYRADGTLADKGLPK